MPNSKFVIFKATYQGEKSSPLVTYLKENSPLSGRSLRKYFFKGLVYLNQKKAHSQANLKPGDCVVVYQLKAEYQALQPEDMPLEIIYENEDLLVVNKPALLVVHPVKQITAGTLANRVAAYFQTSGLTIKVRPVNRLDYGTSGLIIFAKSAPAQAALSMAIQAHQIARIYYAIVQGVPANPEGIINLPIGMVKGHWMIVKNGRPAETAFRVIGQLPTISLLEVSLKTGRTHQIRIHLQAIGCPIIGDLQYGVKYFSINHPALHAGKLNFTASPFKIPELVAPFPTDLQAIIDQFPHPIKLAAHLPK